MFTGIIECIGTVKAVKGAALEISAPNFLAGVSLGDSIAVNGVCLTAASIGGDVFYADAAPETLRQTNLGLLAPGAKVNLEKALTLQKPLGGHLVSGHVDGTGSIVSLAPEGRAVWITVKAAPQILKYIVGRGSITVDGVSLTAAHVSRDSFRVSIIPHTGGNTILLGKKPGDTVNLECDLIGKYVEKLLGLSSAGIDEDFLRKNGF